MNAKGVVVGSAVAIMLGREDIVAVRIMSYLASPLLPIGYSIDRKTADGGYDKEQLPRLNHNS
jgi:hypothetical protein